MTGLTDLLFPKSLDDFMAWVSARQFHHIPSEDPHRWSHLFSWKRVGDMVARQQVLAANLRVFSNGRLVNPEFLGIFKGDGSLCPITIQRLMRQGASLALSKIQGSNDELWELACDVERRLGDKTSITAIASFSSVSAMPLHYDAQDILILQIEGKKHWSFLGEPVEGSGVSRPLESKPTKVTGSITLSAGDVLFVPSGQHHQCQPEGRSLHLAVLIRRLTGQDYIRHLSRRTLNDKFFDIPIPLHQEEQVFMAYELALKERLLGIIERMTLPAMIQENDTLEQGLTGIDLIGTKFNEHPSARVELFLRRSVALPEQDMMQISGCSFLLTPALRTAIQWLNDLGGMTVVQLRKGLAELHGIDEANKALIDLDNYGIAFIRMKPNNTAMDN